MNRLLTPLIIIAFGFGLAFIIIISGPKLEPRPVASLPPLVRVIKVQAQTVTMRTLAHGTVAPRTESELVPEVSGRILNISTSMVSGGFFKKGEVLVNIDPLDYDVALTQTKAGIARANSELDNAHKSYQRQLNLAKKQSTSASARDDAFNRLQIAKATLDEAKAKLARAKRDIKRTHLTAPFDGRVRREKIDIGQFVNRGATIATIYATDAVEVRLPIQDEELAFLDPALGNGTNTPENPIQVTLRARYAGLARQWYGQVVRTEGELDPKTHMINVVASIRSDNDKNAMALPVGLFVEAEIHGLEVNNIVLLPRAALRDNNMVYVVDNNDKLAFKEINILRIAEDLVYIDTGLTTGERVIISPMDNAIRNMEVRVNTIKVDES